MNLEEAATPQTSIVSAKFSRPAEGPLFKWRKATINEVPYRNLPGWQSNGGDSGHADQTLPFSLDTEIPDGKGELVAVHFIGIFALHSDTSLEGVGTFGAIVTLTADGKRVFREQLVNGRHYVDSQRPPVGDRRGAGFTVTKVGETTIKGKTHRVDHLRLEIPAKLGAEKLRFQDLGSPCSFIIFELAFEFQTVSVCPFRAKMGGIALGDVPSIVRVGDRVRYNKAIDQMSDALHRLTDLDEARGLALTFLAVTSAATLEMGGSRTLHRLQLEASRALEEVKTIEEVMESLSFYLEEVAGPLMGPKSSPSERLIEKALAVVEKTYMRDLSDESMAHQLGLSTSHFRYLFRKVTGQPFHKYLMSVRLEKARQMLLDSHLQVSEVAEAVGFSGLSHFSRVFTARFNVSPSVIRRLPS